MTGREDLEKLLAENLTPNQYLELNINEYFKLEDDYYSKTKVIFKMHRAYDSHGDDSRSMHYFIVYDFKDYLNGDFKLDKNELIKKKQLFNNEVTRLRNYLKNTVTLASFEKINEFFKNDEKTIHESLNNVIKHIDELTRAITKLNNLLPEE